MTTCPPCRLPRAPGSQWPCPRAMLSGGQSQGSTLSPLGAAEAPGTTLTSCTWASRGCMSAGAILGAGCPLVQLATCLSRLCPQCPPLSPEPLHTNLTLAEGSWPCCPESLSWGSWGRRGRQGRGLSFAPLGSRLSPGTAVAGWVRSGAVPAQGPGAGPSLEVGHQHPSSHGAPPHSHLPTPLGRPASPAPRDPAWPIRALHRKQSDVPWVKAQ